MQQSQYITVTDKKNNLNCIHYNDSIEYPSPYGFYKGIIVDNNNLIVARSFTLSPTIVTNCLPEDDSSYIRFYEGTVLRFYRYQGKPYISTHKRVDISDIKSRVKNNKTFFELANEAISSWDYVEKEINTAQGKYLEYTPTSWEQLCIEGWCNVFILVDESNSLTDINALGSSIGHAHIEGKDEKIVDNNPRLLHVMSLQVDGAKMLPQIHMPTVYGNIDDGKYVAWVPHVPSIEQISKQEGEKILKDGGAVIGYQADKPDETVKYVSEEYNYKLELVGDTLNRVLRWHELMDKDPKEAEVFLSILPKSERKTYTKDYMEQIKSQYNMETANFIAPYLMRRLNNQYAPLDPKLYNNIKDALFIAYGKLISNKTRTLIDAQSILLQEITKLKYLQQHSAHSCVLKIRRQISNE